jgi:AcrR family transcriptional regulator
MVYRTTPKMAKRKEAHRARLLRTAIRLFGKQGYHATTVPRIVRESGSSTGAF